MFKSCSIFFNKNLGDSQRYKAFTLAEVLITLGIIGVVAAMTIPTLLNATQDMEYKTAYKGAYADLSNAVKMVTVSDSLSLTDFDSNFQKVMANMKVTESCLSDNNSKCWDSTGEPYGAFAAPYEESDAFVDTNGRAWSLPFYTNPISNYYIFVDTNGFKKPNRWGKDRFAFYWNAVSGQIVVRPFEDNYPNACVVGNACNTKNDYYGTSWLYN